MLPARLFDSIARPFRGALRPTLANADGGCRIIGDHPSSDANPGRLKMPIITDDDIGHTIFGSPGSDTINALGGDDTIIPQLGADIVDGGAGLLDLLAVDYSTTLTPVTMSTPEPPI